MNTPTTFTPDPVAADLVGQHAARAAFRAVTMPSGDRLDLAQAYAVQDGYFAGRNGADPVAGYKIGLTSAAMQAMCGIDRPVYGRMAARLLHQGDTVLRFADYQHLGLEFEIAVRLHTALPLSTTPLSREEVARHVEAVCAAFELIDDRGCDYATLDAGSLVADNAWSEGAVLGTWHPLPGDLAQRMGKVECDGETIAEAAIGEAMGHPLDAVAWLGVELAGRGRALEAGAIVMTGSITRTRFPLAGQKWAYAVEGLGVVRLGV
jgi:2-keto-4-pentenoate hydratase